MNEFAIRNCAQIMSLLNLPHNRREVNVSLKKH